MSTSNGATRAAIVTGASRGIGRAIALRLARDGFAVVVNYAGRRDDAEAVVSEIERSGGRAVAVQADVSDPAQAAGLFERAEAAFGGDVDVLVNNAGLLQVSPLAETDDAAFGRLVAVNITGAFNMMREAARRLREGGRIVSLSSSALATSLPGYAGYNATKAAVEAMTRVLAKELGPKRITVNAVAPGPVATELFFDGKSPEQVARMAALSPLNRLGEPGDIAPVVSFLVGPEGGWVNGQVVRANGGLG
jgi:3-oxoacyl-[acyl-carrier protein] reductase